jgi:heptosyltransferase-3
VVHPGALGDTILALPVLAALKQRFQPAVLHVIGHPSLVAFLPGRSIVDAMTSVGGIEYRQLLESDIETPPAGSIWRQFDCVVVWSQDTDAQLSSKLTRWGVSQVAVCSPRLKDGGNRHATDRFKDTVAHLLDAQDLPETRITVTDADRQQGALWLSTMGVSRSGIPLVAIHPGSGSPSKCWPPEQFAEVIKWLQGRGASIVLIEGPADAAMVAGIMRLTASLEIRQLQNATLSAVASVLAHCTAYIGNDSGVTHVAAAVGVPTVALYGPTDPAVWALRCKNVIALRGGACRCPTLDLQRDCGARVCFSIQPGQVLTVLQEVLQA